MSSAPCRFGYEEHDGSRYCFEHGGFWEATTPRRCHRAPLPDPALFPTPPHPDTVTEPPF